ncbi:hypothetical protein [Pseudoxanthomonas winnipegensis]|uniref:hypothetical protein n=1 Tax=Pseudoxanthomonas winnipegensis TaxID=2480810 RepID=UPI00103F9F52|nr:hypothetical protein [Pseudoxanthomonas winnipegensis]TBV69945.1 hypothetical protein EYC45_18870 [Pseudoxanthomonas winnipegensis]
MAHVSHAARTASHADPRLELTLRTIALTGLALVVLLPAARGSTEALGWTPLWLAGLPLVAWWSLHRFRLPSWPAPAPPAIDAVPRRRRGGQQARRRRSMTIGSRSRSPARVA